MFIDYSAIVKALRKKLGKKAVTNDYHRRFAWSTDASYFRIVPEIVVRAENIHEVIDCLTIANHYNAPITFRAAGTSLSGQAIGEGILLVLGFDGFRDIEINKDASHIRLGSAVIGAEANAALKPFNKKIGPDPATLAVAKIGGIIANNSSGMCCGTKQNSYQTLISAKLVFADGTRLDTGNIASKKAFSSTHRTFLAALSDLSIQTKNNLSLSARIKRKYAIKNTTGYSLNALIDFTNPFDIINHLIVGSEGTLAFVEEVTYQTVEEALFKASALAVFFNIEDAASAIPLLDTQKVASAELLDFSSIKAIRGKKTMPSWLSDLPENATILLIESRADNKAQLQRNTQHIINALSMFKTARPIEFTDDEEIYRQYWAMRSSLYPIVAGERKKGTAVIIEDIAFSIKDLAQAIKELTALFHQHHYQEGVIFGHALAGNIHFIVTPAFNCEADVEQFRHFMQDVSNMVINKYDGSMKAEHGTGRAVAPFVEMEWGEDAYRLMKQIKQLFDPKNLLNPGVILNNDKNVFIKNIKVGVLTNSLVDKCIDCGFCEKTCPTSALSMSPRQRIATLRQISNLEQQGDYAEAKKLKINSKYDVIDTCISCELCNLACPVDIGMGQLANELRATFISAFEQKRLDIQAKHFAKTNQAIKAGLNLLDLVHQSAGSTILGNLASTARKVSKQVPNWHSSFPKASRIFHSKQTDTNKPAVVYFPACGGRLFGASPQDKDSTSLAEVVETLISRAGFAVIKPKQIESLCCGQLWQSKGDKQNALTKHQELISAITDASQGGTLPVVIDALSCTYQTLSTEPSIKDKIQLIDLVDFIHDELLKRLSVSHKKAAISLHLGCSAKKMHIEPKMQAIARACAHHVIQPDKVDCCGYAGEKGLYFPEISQTALRHLKQGIGEQVKEGYYANRMCELGLNIHSGISYRHLAYLFEECTR